MIEPLETRQLLSGVPTAFPVHITAGVAFTRAIASVPASSAQGSTFFVDWGDGSPGALAIRQADGRAFLRGTHTYSKGGRFTITVTEQMPVAGGAVGAVTQTTVLTETTPDSSTAHLVLPQTLPATAVSTKPLPPISATLEDQYGNIIKNSKTAVTLAVVSGPAGEVLKGRATVPYLNGVATFRTIRLSPPGAYTLQLSDSALPGNGAAPSILGITLT